MLLILLLVREGVQKLILNELNYLLRLRIY